MEAVKTWRCSREELPGVEGAERSEGDGGNWGGPRWPSDCGVRWSAASYNRATGKGTAGQQGVGGGRSTDRAGWTTQPPVMGRAAASSVRRLEGGPVSARAASPTPAVGVEELDAVRALQHALYRAAKADPGRRFARAVRQGLPQGRLAAGVGAGAPQPWRTGHRPVDHPPGRAVPGLTGCSTSSPGHLRTAVTDHWRRVGS